jgi:hypothetical protein
MDVGAVLSKGVHAHDKRLRKLAQAALDVPC